MTLKKGGDGMPIEIIIGYVTTVVLGLLARGLLDLVNKKREATRQREEVDY